MTDNPYRVHAIHYADGEVEDLDAMRRDAAATEAWRRSAGNAERLIERIKSGELAWDGTQWTAPPVPVLVDHTDPEQVRRAAGVVEGIGADRGAANPESYWECATSLRRQANRLEAAARELAWP
ncbi:hypothetical protein SEA_BAXTERFOX_61 [Gordonia phage BaxterFox]|uniref:Uncharacterized protein n=1 Tax=Gordonia phage BaxterFox TaxID=1821549 RepID=A0A142KCN8_9CAUD|nr:hypothetical protein SEA_BAXTERFOX_61 [Gordonia phage BaxterFox]AMS03871.1 hypothetical protein SEA_BAXTERFOX_61 [Gordonia phage BaxterFox]